MHDIFSNLSSSLLQMKHVLHPSRIQHNGDIDADVQQGPVARILFRLRPCVNLSYCLLLNTHPPVSYHNRGGGWRFGIGHVRSSRPYLDTRGLGHCSARYHKDRIPQGVFGVSSYALYASAPSHVFGQMLGLPGSCVLLPYVPLHRLTQHQENYCDCAPVRPGEHLSRESRKLTFMI